MVEIWTKDKQKRFKNALYGLPPYHKSWQEWYNEGNMQEVYNYWKNLADKEILQNHNSNFWRVIIEMIDFKINEAKQSDNNTQTTN